MSFQPPPGGPPPPGQPYPPPQGYGAPPQQPWPQQPWAPGPPPKKRGNGWKWALGGVALLAVIGVTAAVTISVTRDDSSTPTSPSGNDFGLASANDKGPANIITEDPSCAAWSPIANTLADTEQNNGWVQRDPAIAAADWTPEQRSGYEAVGRAMRSAADQTVALAKLTPHRVMREFYEQFVAYARAYSDAIPHYTAVDDHLARVVNSSSGAVTFACAAIEFQSAQARAPLVPAPAPPKEVPEPTDPTNPARYLITTDTTCADWYRLLDRFDNDTPEATAWKALDANIPASSWTPQQQAAVDAVIPVMTQLVDDIERLGQLSTNATLRDFATFAAQYRRAYLKALPTYTAADSYLARTSARATSTIYEACKAVGS